jgi:hypothetical protein
MKTAFFHQSSHGAKTHTSARKKTKTTAKYWGSGSEFCPLSPTMLFWWIKQVIWVKFKLSWKLICYRSQFSVADEWHCLYDVWFFPHACFGKGTQFSCKKSKKSSNRKRELGTGSIDPILFVKDYLDAVLFETACAPNQIIIMEDCGPQDDSCAWSERSKTQVSISSF